ncbi:MAG TPA: ECF transporter S component [Ruminococcaceae bacterium]|nr:ECF transporter S component [Oscillospiraceae bacterium]HCA72363.1 ECF transporter S component [Oscillospiraceae bacterium]HCM22886.1 ECF transporter S component [Oscillospiraceae bacterium]
MALFAAITLIMGFTPLGFIPLPFIKLTIIHIPVILGSILLGPQYGAILGALFGLTSLINNTVVPAVTSFTFSPFIPLPGTTHGTPVALLICFLPRILVGIFPYYVFQGMNKLLKGRDKQIGALAVSGVAGALTNTAFVMGLIYFLFRDAYAAAKGIAPDAVPAIIMGIVSFNGVIEAIAAGIIVAAVGKVLLQFVQTGKKSKGGKAAPEK